MEEQTRGKGKKVNIWKVAVAILAVLLLISVFRSGSGLFDITGGTALNQEEAAEKAVDYINENLLQGVVTAELIDVEEEGDLYLLKLNVGGEPYEFYITKDGSLFFPSAISLDDIPEPTPSQPQEPADIPKSDKPELEVFIFSYCPYGLQYLKGMLPVVELFGDKVEFKVWHIGSMHGLTEEMEAKHQLCIREEQPDKFWDYIECFVYSEGEADVESCLAEAGVDKAKWDDCMANRVEEYYNADMQVAQSRGVSGSPTAFVNGVRVQGRSPEAIKESLCLAFNEEPAECSQTLSSENPSPGFGGGSGGSTGGQC